MLKSIKIQLVVCCFIWPAGLLPLFSTLGHAAPERIPAFELGYIDGSQGTISDANLMGKVTLLNLWASWCPGCKDEMPELMELQDLFGPDRFTVLAVNIDNKLENALSFIEKFPERVGRPLNFPILYDEKKVLPKALHPKFLPTSYLVDVQGRIILVLGGSITEDRLDEIQNAIRSALEIP